MSEFRVEKSLIEPENVFLAELHGLNRVDVSLENARTLVGRALTSSLNGIIIDYSNSVLGHDMDSYRQIADVFGNGLPKGLPFAYIFNPMQTAHILFITRQLNQHGVLARAFPSQQEAREWVLPQAQRFAAAHQSAA